MNEIENYSKLDAILNNFKRDKDNVILVGTYIENDGFKYFEDAYIKNEGYFNTNSFTNVERALKHLNATYWRTLLNDLGIIEMMTADKRDKWNKDISEYKTPPFERDNVVATAKSLLANKDIYFAERVDSVFRGLSGEHVTNRPEGFSKRMIFNNVHSGIWHNTYKSDVIHDLRYVITKFNGIEAINTIGNDINNIIDNNLFGEWIPFDGGAFKLKIFKKGTAHIEVHPIIAAKLNKILASLHPNAIPSKFKVAPIKYKEHDLVEDLISFEDINELNKGRIMKLDDTWSMYIKMSKSIKNIVLSLGGIVDDISSKCTFDYNPIDILKYIRMTRMIPDKKTHQYYPTTDEVLLEECRELLGVDNYHTILEPSAGVGSLIKGLSNIDCVEISSLNRKILEMKGHNVICEDFMKLPLLDYQYDRIIMNPPYSKGRYKEHVSKAYLHLKSNGILVAIVPTSFNCDEYGNCEEYTTHKFAFTDSGTNIDVKIIRLFKV